VPGPWTNITYNAGCSGNVQVRLINNGTTVEMRGQFMRPNGGGRITLGTVPAGFRPPGLDNRYAVGLSANSASYGTIGVAINAANLGASAGNIDVWANPPLAAWSSAGELDGITYSIG
jgi:hypothetical protein